MSLERRGYPTAKDCEPPPAVMLGETSRGHWARTLHTYVLPPSSGHHADQSSRSCDGVKVNTALQNMKVAMEKLGSTSPRD